MHRLVKTVMLAVAAAVGAAALEGCYISVPGEMDSLKGTYELTEFTRLYTGEEEKHDLIAEKEIRAYLAIGDDGWGYYYYEDLDREAYCERVKISYVFSENAIENEEGEVISYEKTDEVTKIEYTSGGRSSGGYPGGGKESLGYNARAKTLHMYLPSFKLGILERNNTQSVTYKKIGEETDLSLIREKTGKDLRVADYMLKGLSGTFVSENYGMEEESNAIYLLEIDAFAKKADLTEVDKNGVAVKTSGLDLSYSLVGDYGEYEIRIGEKVYYGYAAGDEYINSLFIRYPVSGNCNYFWKADENFDLEAETAAILEYYRSAEEAE